MEQHRERDNLRFAKKRRVTDKSLPNVILTNPQFTADSALYTDLIDMEKKLDWTMMRKRVEIQDAITKVPSATRTLRIFMSHTVSGQSWQNAATAASAEGEAEISRPPEGSENIPAWQFKIEGRILEGPNQRSKNAPPTRKFSTCVKRMVIEFDRDPTLYPDGNIVEWPRQAGTNNPVTDGFSVRRTGDVPVNIRVIMSLDNFPEQVKVHPELSNIINITQGSRIEVLRALWDYIKVNNLQDKVDRRMIKSDQRLGPLFHAAEIPFPRLPEYVNRFIHPCDPIVLHYSIDPSIPPLEKAQAFDVPIQMEDTALKSRMSSVVSPSRDVTSKITKIDDEIALLTQSLHNSHLKRQFLQHFADDPAKFIQTWLESQSRDLETILGSGLTDGMTMRQEELRRSEFFKLPWVEEAVSIQEGIRLKQVMSAAGMQ